MLPEEIRLRMTPRFLLFGLASLSWQYLVSPGRDPIRESLSVRSGDTRVCRNCEEAIPQKLGSAARLFSGREKWSQLLMLLQRHRVSAHRAQGNLRRHISNNVDERQP